MKKRLDWIDYGKGICMLIVVLYHTLCYYVHDDTLAFLFYPFFLTFFFFLSGYTVNIQEFKLKKSIESIIYKLLIPYLLFTTIIWIPKTLAHGGVISLQSMIYDIVVGYASWFVASLVVAKLILSGIIVTTKSLKNIWFISTPFIIIGFISTIYISHPCPWYFNYGLISLIYILLGCTYRKYESFLPIISKRNLFISVIIYVILIIINQKYPTSIYYYSMTSENISLWGVISFLSLSLSGIWMMLNIVTILPANIKCLRYVGRHSLIYYFLNGGVITICVMICNLIGFNYNTQIYREILLYLVVIFILTLLTFIIMKVCPWMVGDFNKKT